MAEEDLVSPLDRVPVAYVAAQWSYLAAATGRWSRLWRRIVAAWRCSRVASAHVARQRAWRRLRAAHRRYLRAGGQP